MFKKLKCPKCHEKISDKYSFCPYCGSSFFKKDSEEYGLLGRNDFEKENEMMKLPFGFNMFLKPLMKELMKQMEDLDKEMRSDNKKVRTNNGVRTNFSIHIGTPGHKPIKIGEFSENNIENNQIVKQKRLTSRELPKISELDMKKFKNLPREEPETNVRRLSDRIVYEMKLYEVKSLKDININQLEEVVEIKAISKNKIFVKNIELDLPLVNLYFQNNNLILEFGLK